MARKDFHFDFDEDADPVEELHRLRVAATKHFKTIEALIEYHNSVPPVEEIKARLRMEIAAKNAGAARTRKVKSVNKPAGRRKTAKRPVHA